MTRCLVEVATQQRVPSSSRRGKEDARDDTIAKDADYLKFVADLTAEKPPPRAFVSSGDSATRAKRSRSLCFFSLLLEDGRLLSRGNEDISFPNRSTLRLPRPPPRRRRNLPVLPDPRETRPKALRPFFGASLSASSRLAPTVPPSRTISRT